MTSEKDAPSYDNLGYVATDDDVLEEGRVAVEPAPHQYLPRIISADRLADKPSKTLTTPPKADLTGPLSLKTDDPSNQDEEQGADGRDTWDNPLEFLLSCISMSVGLGNVWRFPGVAAANGGGAFLIPYLIVLLLIGRPLYYMEMCMGQFSRYGQVKVWNMAPLFKGVGYGAIMGTICICSYYCSLLGITVYYFTFSFSKELPWAKCHPEKLSNMTCDQAEGQFASIYYNKVVYPQLPNIDNGLGKLNWQLALCLAFSWLLIFLALAKGVKSSGKVAYFTAIFPYAVLIILLVRGVTLSGAWKGIKVFLEPQWAEIGKPKVWYAAVEQCFFSLGIGFGPVIMFSSYNNFRSNVYKDALIISLLDTATSLLAGITIFAVIGHLMEINNKEFSEIDGVGGSGLAFVLYPQAIASFGWAPQLFAVLFFLMFFTLGLGTASSLTGGIITIICDQFPEWKRWMVTLVISVLGCLVGLMYVTEGGTMMLDLVDRYGAGFIIYVMAMLECGAIAYVYGLSNFCNDIEFMLGRRVGIYWRICWGFIIPVGLLANLLYYLITQPEFTSNGTAYPKVATICGWLLTTFAVAMVPAWGIHAVVTRKADTLKEKFLLALKPTFRWGPQQPKLRKEWQDFRTMKDAQGTRKRFILF